MKFKLLFCDIYPVTQDKGGGGGVGGGIGGVFGWSAPGGGMQEFAFEPAFTASVCIAGAAALSFRSSQGTF